MNVRLRHARDVAIFDLQGRVSHDTTAKLHQMLEVALRAQCRHVIIRLSECELVVSTGIRFFVETHDRLEAAAGRLVLCHLPSDLQYALKVAKLEEFFNVAESFGDALFEFGILPEMLREGLPAIAKRTTSVTAVRRSSQELAQDMAKDVDSATAEEAKGAAVGARGGRDAKSSSGAFDPDTFTEKDMAKIVRRHIPGRLAVEILDWFVTHGHSLGQVAVIAKALNQKPSEVKNTAQLLVARGVLKGMGGETYNYAPSVELNAQLKEFLLRWHRPAEHSKLLGMVLAQEED